MVVLHPATIILDEVLMTALQFSRESKTGLSLDMVIDERFGQRQKAPQPISVTESGMAMLVSPVQPSKARFPILDTESGKLMLVGPWQPLKASSAISVTESGMMVVLHPAIILPDSVSMSALQFCRES